MTPTNCNIMFFKCHAKFEDLDVIIIIIIATCNSNSGILITSHTYTLAILELGTRLALITFLIQLLGV